ncbi:hypothetical protein G1H11_00290 [Phytoactinopolyspora alkaliphila]|uniref:Uncharacterized protein n=1 Tax=Phytoactinopolyspora alkaliphila TaxID=1783498 RepID=A0A6N9YFC4_9ACTN|nr:hypothetical protein [Phytoactinopolyspora alkaliphila]NED93751.1 hypothetical protein [Phytoactinopolyspora alkaliphila]
MADGTGNTSRRRFLRGAAGLSAGTAGAIMGWPAALSWGTDAGRTVPAGLEHVTREAFDQLDQSFNGGDGYKYETNDKDSSGLSGKLAWGEAYSLQAYALMFQTYRDTYYLDKMVDHLDHVLAARDSERGVTDHTGASRPAWRADHHYTVGYVTLPDTLGRPVFQVRTALAYADATSVTVAPGTAAGTFRLDVHNTQYGRTTSHDNLSPDPASPDYAVSRVLNGFRRESPHRVLVTLKDVRESGSETGDMASGEYSMVSEPYIFEAHTGQIALPLVVFARMVDSYPELGSVPLYRDRAALYLAAAEEAVGVHDPEWRETELGEGYYVTLPDAPVWHAGIDNPINHFLTVGRATVQLAAATGDPVYADRATKMARTLRGSLSVDAGGAYIWPYWWPKGAAYRGWDVDAPLSEYRPWYPGNQSIEDTSHGQIDMNFALEVFRDGRTLHRNGRPVFTGEDMERFAATFSQNIAATTDAGAPTVHRFIDGSGDTGLEAYERMSASWAGLAPWDQEVLSHSADIFAQRELVNLPSTLYCMARLNHAAWAPSGRRRR